MGLFMFFPCRLLFFKVSNQELACPVPTALVCHLLPPSVPGCAGCPREEHTLGLEMLFVSSLQLSAIAGGELLTEIAPCSSSPTFLALNRAQTGLWKVVISRCHCPESPFNQELIGLEKKTSQTQRDTKYFLKPLPLF